MQELLLSDGIDFGVCALIYLSCLLPRWRNKREAVLKSVFAFYLVGVCYVTLMPFLVPVPFLTLSMSSWNLNLWPFADFLLGHGGALREFVLNVIMTIPFGLLVSLLTRRRYTWVIAMTFCFSLGIELIQLVSVMKANSCDATDLISNTLGGALGCLLYGLFKRPLHGLVKRLPQTPCSFSKLAILHRHRKAILVFLFFALLLRTWFFLRL